MKGEKFLTRDSLGSRTGKFWGLWFEILKGFEVFWDENKIPLEFSVISSKTSKKIPSKYFK